MKEFINTLVKNRKPLLIGLGVIGIIVLWLGSTILSLVHNKLEIKNLTHKNALLDSEYQELIRTNELLEKQDPALIEKIARTQYDLAKPNEIEFRLPKN